MCNTCEGMNVEFTEVGVSEQWLDGRRTESCEAPCKKSYCHNEAAQQEGAALYKLQMCMYMSQLEQLRRRCCQGTMQARHQG